MIGTIMNQEQYVQAYVDAVIQGMARCNKNQTNQYIYEHYHLSDIAYAISACTQLRCLAQRVQQHAQKTHQKAHPQTQNIEQTNYTIPSVYIHDTTVFDYYGSGESYFVVRDCQPYMQNMQNDNPHGEVKQTASNHFMCNVCYYGHDDQLLHDTAALFQRNAVLKNVAPALDFNYMLLAYTVLIQTKQHVDISQDLRTSDVFIQQLKTADFAIMPPTFAGFYGKNNTGLSVIHCTPQTALCNIQHSDSFKKAKQALIQKDTQFALLPADVQQQSLMLWYELEMDGICIDFLQQLKSEWGVAIDDMYLQEVRKQLMHYTYPSQQ